MAVTEADFRGAFPAFSDPLAFPPAQIQFYLDLGYNMHNPDRWGAMLDFGVQLWTAHNLSMDAASAAAGGAPGAMRGNVTSMSADGVSWSRDFGSVVDPQAGHWNLTAYGVRWRAIMNLVGAGPVYVGAPSVLESYLAGPGGWSGPWWNDGTTVW